MQIPSWARSAAHPVGVALAAFAVTMAVIFGVWWMLTPSPPKAAAPQLPPVIHLSSSLSEDTQHVSPPQQAAAPAALVPEASPPPVAEALPAPAASAEEPSSAMGYEGQIYEEPPLPGVRITDALSALNEQTATPDNAAPSKAAAPPAANSSTKANSKPQQTAGGIPSPAWIKNATPAPASGGKVKVAIVIDDMGVDVKRSAGIMALPGPLTTSFLTYAKNLPEQTQHAHSVGHELMVHFPMEPQARNIDAGPEVLRVGMDDAEIMRRLNDGLSRFNGYVGINNHMGSRFTENSQGMRDVMKALKARGVFWLDSRTTPKSVGEAMAAEAGVPHVGRHIFLDNEESVGSVMAQLVQVEKVAHKLGYAIAIGHPRDQTIAALSRWLPTLAQKGIVLVPLSTIVRQQSGRID